MSALRWMGLTALAVVTVGCGYSEDEWQAQLAKYGQLEGEHTALKAAKEKERQELEAKIAAVESELATERKRTEQLEADLEKAGLDLNKLTGRLEAQAGDMTKLNQVLEEREKALAEYKKRAAQLEAIKARFAKLREKLDALTNIGLTVKIRNNRMVISLPGDVLFASGRVELKKDGEEILDKVGAIINADASLSSRVYQVAGHTDSVAFTGGIYKDNWGLSLMRARQVLVTAEGKQANRRCELILVPSAEEMLDLKDIAKTP